MGEARWRPQRLAEKLLHIRRTLDLSQSELHKALGFEEEEISYNRISDYELDKFDPPLPVLVEYARVARVHLEDIADDRVSLPESLPGTVIREAWKLPRPKRPKHPKTKKA
jgi:transcriptional regulator with XRE-family HTH domain